MRKTKGTKEKIEAMEAERQVRIDALPEIPRWTRDTTDDMVPDDDGMYVRHSDYEAMTEWLRAENARLRMGDTWFEQRKGYEAEVMRLQAHVERGRALLHRVTYTIGEKQAERDLAYMRLESLNRLVIVMTKCFGYPPGEIRLSLASIKEETGEYNLITELDGEDIVLKAEKTTEEKGDADGQTTDGQPPMVPSSHEGTNPGQPGDGIPVKPDQDLPAD